MHRGFAEPQKVAALIELYIVPSEPASCRHVRIRVRVDSDMGGAEIDWDSS
jgi:hypothetical protein